MTDKEITEEDGVDIASRAVELLAVYRGARRKGLEAQKERRLAFGQLCEARSALSYATWEQTSPPYAEAALDYCDAVHRLELFIRDETEAEREILELIGVCHLESFHIERWLLGRPTGAATQLDEYLKTQRRLLKTQKLMRHWLERLEAAFQETAS